MNVSKYGNIILKVLAENPIHPNANELYQLVRKVSPEVGIASIYRNLDKLTEEGRVHKFCVGDYDRYDGNVDEHYHMICSKCSKVFDIMLSDIVDTDRVNNITGHSITWHSLIFKGMCKECINKEEK